MGQFRTIGRSDPHRAARIVRHTLEQAVLGEGLGEIFHAKCDGQQVDTIADVAAVDAAPHSDLHNDFGGGDDWFVCLT